MTKNLAIVVLSMMAIMLSTSTLYYKSRSEKYQETARRAQIQAVQFQKENKQQRLVAEQHLKKLEELLKQMSEKTKIGL
jgi:hypothetical protein